MREMLLGMCDRVFTLIPQVAWLGNTVTQRYNRMSWIAEIVNCAASAAIETGDFSRAVEWLEQGRAVVWGQLLRLRSPVDELSNRYPDISARLQSISQKLERSGHSTATASAAIAPTNGKNDILDRHGRALYADTDEISTRLTLAEEYDTLLNDIRRLPGFERFLLPKTIAELTLASKDGPIILLNVHTSRSDALIVHRTADHIIRVPLPELTHELAEQMRSQLVQALNQSLVRDRTIARDSLEITASNDRGLVKIAATSTISRVLGLLWRRIVWPVLQALKEDVSEYDNWTRYQIAHTNLAVSS
jgi:hypothetical protein